MDFFDMNEKLKSLERKVADKMNNKISGSVALQIGKTYFNDDGDMRFEVDQYKMLKEGFRVVCNSPPEESLPVLTIEQVYALESARRKFGNEKLLNIYCFDKYAHMENEEVSAREEALFDIAKGDFARALYLGYNAREIK